MLNFKGFPFFPRLLRVLVISQPAPGGQSQPRFPTTYEGMPQLRGKLPRRRNRVVTRHRGLGWRPDF